MCFPSFSFCLTCKGGCNHPWGLVKYYDHDNTIGIEFKLNIGLKHQSNAFCLVVVKTDSCFSFSAHSIAEASH